jgi:hypothetical protein
MTTNSFSHIALDQLIMVGVTALIVLLVRALRHRKRRRRLIFPQIPSAPDLPAMITQELMRELADLPPGLSPRQARKTVKLSLLRYERELHFEEEE